MKQRAIWLILAGYFLLASCALVETAPGDGSPDQQPLPSPSLTETSGVIFSTPIVTTTAFNTVTPSPMPTNTIISPWVTPTFPLNAYHQTQEIDVHSRLLWSECEVSFDLFHHWSFVEHCFGFPLPSWQEDDRVRFGEFFERESHIYDDIRITINGDVYETDNQPDGLYTLYKNGEIFAQSISGSTTYPPNRSLQEVDGKVVWELADPWHPTILFDGQDLRLEHNLDAAYIPYSINAGLIFVAKLDSSYFVMYDGVQIGPNFDEISIGYCCGPALYSVRRVQGQYWFWGVREDLYFLIVISSNE